MFRTLILIALISGMAQAAAPPKPAVRKAVDGTPLPEVALSLPKNFALPSGAGPDVARVERLLLHPPEAIDPKIYSLSVESSQKLLARRMERTVSHTAETTDSGRTESVTTGRTVNDTMQGVEWFTWGPFGADAIGMTLHDGVVVRIVLYWRNPTALARSMLADVEHRKVSQRWQVLPCDGSIELSVDADPELVAIARGEKLDQAIADAVRNHKIARGMDPDQATKALGQPYQETNNGWLRTMSWVTSSGAYVHAEFQNDLVVSYVVDDQR